MKKTIFLAGGCFWGVEAYFKQLKGVLDTTVGYCNGESAFPSYEDVKSHKASHAETVKIDYDNEVISLEELLEHYLRFVDPYSLDKQGNDIGHQYRSGIYYNDLYDAMVASTYLSEHIEGKHMIEIKKMSNFYPAEEYHQDYLDKNPHGYCHVNLNLIKPSEKK